MSSAAWASAPAQIREDEGGAAQSQRQKDENGAVHEELLGQDVDDLVGIGVEEPVVLPREEQGVEHHEGPVEVQRGKAAHNEESAPQARPRPEAGPPAKQGREGAPAQPGAEEREEA